MRRVLTRQAATEIFSTGHDYESTCVDYIEEDEEAAAGRVQSRACVDPGLSSASFSSPQAGAASLLSRSSRWSPALNSSSRSNGRRAHVETNVSCRATSRTP